MQRSQGIISVIRYCDIVSRCTYKFLKVQCILKQAFLSIISPRECLWAVELAGPQWPTRDNRV